MMDALNCRYVRHVGYMRQELHTLIREIGEKRARDPFMPARKVGKA